MSIYIDTEKLSDISNDFDKLVDTYLDKVDKLYLRFSDVIDETHEWIGDCAKYYFAKAKEDKNQYILFGQQLKCISRELLDLSLDVNEIVKKEQHIEENT